MSRDYDKRWTGDMATSRTPRLTTILCLLKYRNSTFLLMFLLWVTGLLAESAPKARVLPSNQEALTFLTESVDWYRHLMIDQQTATEPADLVFLYDTRPIARQIIQLSFDFARADGSLATSSLEAQKRQAGLANTSPAENMRLVRLEKKAEDAIAEATQRAETIETTARRIRGAKHERAQIELDDLRSRLRLLQAESERLKEVIDFAQTSSGDNSAKGNLLTVIDDLAHSVPEISTATTPTLTSDTSSAPKQRGPGILGLATEVSALQTKLRNVDEETRLTNNLAQSSENLRSLLVALVSPIVESEDLNDLQTNDLHALQQQKARLDDLTVQLKALSPAVVALDKQKVLLVTYKSQLRNWRAAVVNQYKGAWKELVLRLVVVAVIIACLLCVRLVLRRVTNSVRDMHRRRVLLLLQRLVILAAIALVGIFAFAADFNSIATFFGLLTAGAAVALQSVIVASLGYFVLVGKRGIRIGDRIQISGIAGDVLDIGILQFHIREFDIGSQQLTDNVITFSNSFVFVSPATGLFKLRPEKRNASSPESLGQTPHAAAERI